MRTGIYFIFFKTRTKIGIGFDLVVFHECGIQTILDYFLELKPEVLHESEELP
jgi:hypothetical protein